MVSCILLLAGVAQVGLYLTALIPNVFLQIEKHKLLHERIENLLEIITSLYQIEQLSFHSFPNNYFLTCYE